MKKPTIAECHDHLELLAKYEMNLDERHFETFVKPVFQRILEYKDFFHEIIGMRNLPDEVLKIAQEALKEE